ncbi:MAG: MaoC family dehydratase N-terminal domain-containing protein, partial [Rhodococcus fascians]
MTDAMMRNEITDAGLQLMRNRVGYPNPTVRSGSRVLPWWTVTSSDAIRHHVNGYGDDNPLYIDPDYAATTRWGGQIAPPGFVAAGGPQAHREPYEPPFGDALVVEQGDEEDAWIRRLGRTIPVDFNRETRGALRGIQLYSSGHETSYYRPFYMGDWDAGTAGGVYNVDDKVSEFAGRSAIVANQLFSWNQRSEITSMTRHWFVHAERRKAGAATSTKEKKAEEPASYTDEQLAEIEELYENERHRGADTLWYEGVSVGDALPPMVKGPLHLTDMWNQHMGSGWFGYGNPALRLGYENRRKMPGFYTRTIYNSWDVIQRVHWEEAMAQEVGVPLMYDIAPMRNAWVLHYCTNFMGDDAWLAHVHVELRRFNYFGDTTWYSGH